MRRPPEAPRVWIRDTDGLDFTLFRYEHKAIVVGGLADAGVLYYRFEGGWEGYRGPGRPDQLPPELRELIGLCFPEREPDPYRAVRALERQFPTITER